MACGPAGLPAPPVIEESPPPRRADLAGDFGATRFARLLERFWASRDLGTAGTGTAPTGTVQPRDATASANLSSTPDPDGGTECS